MYVVWLASWFPNKTSPLNGDFIERHARATSAYVDILVLHAVKDPNAQDVRVERKQLTPRCQAAVIYYPGSTSSNLWWRLISGIRYFRVQHQFLRSYQKEHGKPSLFHVHVSLQAGLFALWASTVFNIPYCLSEQSTRFLPADPASYHHNKGLTRFLLRTVLRKAVAVSAVSHLLARYMKALGAVAEPNIIPNLVMPEIFTLRDVKKQPAPFRLIHVSNFSYAKNLNMILECMQILHEEDPGAYTLDVIGPSDSVDLPFERLTGIGVAFHGEMLQEQLSVFMRNADALILYSKFETFGCVIVEALSCGVPVLVSEGEPFRDIVQAGVTGLFVEPDQPAALAMQIKNMRTEYDRYRPEHIRANTIDRFGPEKVGRLFNEMYEKILKT